MPRFEFKDYKPWGGKPTAYGQSVRVRDLVYISGQGGWKNDRSYADDLAQQLDDALDNADKALRDAGATLQDVFKWTVYVVGFTNETAQRLIEIISHRYPPDQVPLLTGIGVVSLMEGQLVEVDGIAQVRT